MGCCCNTVVNMNVEQYACVMGLNNGKLTNSASPLPFCEQVELTALGSVNSQAVIISALIVG
jgi:hypothetical protein